MPIPIYQWKNLLINFLTRLPISTNWKGESYDSILVIVDRLTKIVYYELGKVIIDAFRLVEVILDMVIQCHSLHNSIISNKNLLFTFKF